MERSRWYEPKLDPNATQYATTLEADEKAYGIVHMPTRVYGDGGDDLEPTPNLVGSLADGYQKGEFSRHFPVFDFDGVPVRVVPSSTPGNSHLYIDKSISWLDYKKILKAFADAGLIERPWVEATINQGVGFVRLPGVQRNAPRDMTEQLRAELKSQHRLNGESAASQAGHYPSTYFQRDPGDETRG